LSHYRPVLAVIARLGQFLREAGESDALHSQPTRGVGGRFDPAPIGPAAQRVVADPQEIGSLPDPKRRHPVTLTHMRLQSPLAGAFAAVPRLNGPGPHPGPAPEELGASKIERLQKEGTTEISARGYIA
jgi:hypothetical protein